MKKQPHPVRARLCAAPGCKTITMQGTCAKHQLAQLMQRLTQKKQAA